MHAKSNEALRLMVLLPSTTHQNGHAGFLGGGFFFVGGLACVNNLLFFKYKITTKQVDTKRTKTRVRGAARAGGREGATMI